MADSTIPPEKVNALLRRLRAAEKALTYSKGWYSDHYCPFCLQLDGSHTPECLYLAWLESKKGDEDGTLA